MSNQQRNSFYFYNGQSMWATALLMIVTDIRLERTQLFILGEELDWNNGQSLRNIKFVIPLFGMSNGKNYSMGQAFGALLTAYGQQNFGNVGFEITDLIGRPILGFVHQKRAAEGQCIEILNDVFPLEALSFPWYSNN